MAVLVISYSREDQPQIRAVVSLLRAAMPDIDDAIFWDGDFQPGEPWFDQLTTHIDAAPQLFVFWCSHSAASPHVRREFLYAMQHHKRVVPVLMDDTVLPEELAPIHGIDLRRAVVHQYKLQRWARGRLPPETRQTALEADLLNVADVMLVERLTIASMRDSIVAEFRTALANV